MDVAVIDEPQRASRREFRRYRHTVLNGVNKVRISLMRDSDGSTMTPTGRPAPAGVEELVLGYRTAEVGLVSIIVPVLNSAARLERLLASIEAQDYRAVEVIVNDDARSADGADAVVASYAESIAVVYLRQNDCLGGGRLVGAQHARGEFLYFVDADMVLGPGVLAECVRACRDGAIAVCVAEEQVVHEFWSRCKWLDKRVMRDSDDAESVRFVPAQRYWQVGGHHPDLMFAEDKDLDLRIRSLGAAIVRTRHVVRHDEGRLSPARQFRRAYYWTQFRSVTRSVSPAAAASPPGSAGGSPSICGDGRCSHDIRS
ncbi:glycosyltransferase family 2 protein [Catenulispora yoronensis]